VVPALRSGRTCPPLAKMSGHGQRTIPRFTPRDEPNPDLQRTAVRSLSHSARPRVSHKIAFLATRSGPFARGLNCATDESRCPPPCHRFRNVESKCPKYCLVSFRVSRRDGAIFVPLVYWRELHSGQSLESIGRALKIRRDTVAVFASPKLYSCSVM